MTYEIEKKTKYEPVFHVELGYMLGDADGERNEVIHFTPEEFDRVLPYLEILLRLIDATKGKAVFHVDCFDDFDEDEYPGPECGLTEEQYKTLIQMRDDKLPLDAPKEAWVLADSIISEYAYNYAFLEEIIVHYYDEDGRVRGVNFKY